MIIFALGFDAVTGALAHMDVRGRDGLTIAEKWAAGPQAYLGICVEEFPNMFMISGMEAIAAASTQWGALTKKLLDATILAKGDKIHSWFLGANIPVKPLGVLFYFGGAGAYFEHCQRVTDNRFDGIEFTMAQHLNLISTAT